MKILFVAISGGHLAQLKLLSPRICGQAVGWVTDDTNQSRSLLEAERVFHVPTRAPRDWIGVLADSRRVRQAISHTGAECVVSTGSQVALSAYVAAKLMGKPFAYIESATRVTELSASGRVLDRLPGVRRYKQHATTTDRPGWSQSISVFDGFSTQARADHTHIRRIVVTLGGNGEYAFNRLADRVREITPAGVEILWQLGSTPDRAYPGQVVSSLPAQVMHQEQSRADVVIGHAGTGTALGALKAGHVPILSPRSSEQREHVDSHQDDLALRLHDRGLAIMRDASELNWDDVVRASRLEARQEPDGSQLDLFAPIERMRGTSLIDGDAAGAGYRGGD